jgi:GNAT superfamily N-acetyltransferase
MSKMIFTVRKAEPTDLGEIIDLCAEHAAYEQAAYSPEGKAEKLSSHLFSQSPRLFCLLAVDGTDILGYATYMFEFSTWDAAHYIHMDCLYIRPHARGFGIGEALVKQIAKASKENNCNIIQWQTPVFNERAIKFYYRIGATSKEKLRMYLEEEVIEKMIVEN